MKSKLVLPRDHFSWTQLNQWEKSKKKYKDIYFFGEKHFASKEMRFGKEIASTMDGGVAPASASIEALYSLLPKYNKSEFKIEVQFDGINLLGILDTYKTRVHAFREYKTGKIPWTQSRVDKDGQLTFYSLLIYLAKNKSPVKQSIHLDWIRTADRDDTVELTGEIVSFKTARTMVDLLSLITRIKKATREISEEYLSELSV